MKHLFFVLSIISIIFTLSCSSGKDSASRKSERKVNNSEIGTVETEGGELLNISGYSKDNEVMRKMKMLDEDFIDCYKNVIKIGKAENIDIHFSFEIDSEGFFDGIDIVKVPSKEANKIARCIKKEMESVGVRPGNQRTADYRLSYKLVKGTKKTETKKSKMNDLRSKKLASLAQMQKFKECYESRKAKNPKIQGKFTLKFTVAQDGEVYDIKLRNNTLTDKYVINCVITELEDTVFPQGESDDEVEVNFNFTATSANPRPDKPRKSLSL